MRIESSCCSDLRFLAGFCCFLGVVERVLRRALGAELACERVVGMALVEFLDG